MTRLSDKPTSTGTPESQSDGLPPHAAALRPEIDPVVAQFPVNWALYLASAIYARDYGPENSARRTCGNLVIHEFTRALATFPEASRERVYLARILNIAVDLAIGIRTKKEIRASRLEDALQDRDLHYHRMVKAERWQGLLRMAMKLLLLSGFGYAFARTIIVTDGAGRMTPADEKWASAAFGMGFALIATYVRSWIIDRRIGALFRKHDQEARAAHREYQRTVTREYRWATDEAIDAWERMAGVKPELNTAAILSLMAPEDDDIPE